MVGTLSATAVVGVTATSGPQFAGAGALSANAIRSYSVAAPFTGSGALDVASMAGLFGTSANYAGAGALSAIPAPSYEFPLALSGAGALTTQALKERYSRAANMAGNGGLSALMAVKFARSVALSGVGTFGSSFTRKVWPYLDTFNQADGPLSADWVDPNGSGWSVSGNAAVPTATSVDSYALLAYSAATDNVELTATMGTGPLGTPMDGIVEFWIRANDDGSDRVVVQFDITSVVFPFPSATILAKIQVYVGNVLQTETSTASTVIAPGDDFILRAAGNEYTISRGSTELKALADTGNLAVVNSSHRRMWMHANINYPFKVDEIAAQSLSQMQRYRTMPLSGSGTQSATAVGQIPFTPVAYDNIAQTNQAVPVGASEYRVQLRGGGAAGGTGAGGTTGTRSGGGGGGGGAYVDSGWRSVAELGSTYTTTRGAGGSAAGSAATASTFVSGGKTASAGGGGLGGAGSTSVGAAGAAGTASVGTWTGWTGVNGTAGGAGGGSGAAGSSAPDNTIGSSAGGGGGGGVNSTGTTGGNGGDGGSSATVTGATGSASGNGNSATDAAMPNGGAGGGGAKGSSTTAAYSGGNGGDFGGGGGGAGGKDGSGTNTSRGAGGIGMIRVEFR